MGLKKSSHAKIDFYKPYMKKNLLGCLTSKQEAKKGLENIQINNS